MWANIFLSKYSHSRVTNFKQHLKHNNDYTKLFFNEEHLPKHMRLTWPQRLIRFLFIPIVFICSCCVMHQDPIYRHIKQECNKRNSCFASCVTSDFPKLGCDHVIQNIEFDGNSYEKFFFFPEPAPGRDKQYNVCKSYINDNYSIPRAGKDQSRALRIHACFNSCSEYKDCLTLFDLDDRPACSTQNLRQGLLCVDPFYNDCENYVETGMICFDKKKKICIDWRKIIYAIILANCL